MAKICRADLGIYVKRVQLQREWKNVCSPTSSGKSSTLRFMFLLKNHVPQQKIEYLVIQSGKWAKTGWKVSTLLLVFFLSHPIFMLFPYSSPNIGPFLQCVLSFNYCSKILHCSYISLLCSVLTKFVALWNSDVTCTCRIYYHVC